MSLSGGVTFWGCHFFRKIIFFEIIIIFLIWFFYKALTRELINIIVKKRPFWLTWQINSFFLTKKTNQILFSLQFLFKKYLVLHRQAQIDIMTLFVSLKSFCEAFIVSWISQPIIHNFIYFLFCCYYKGLFFVKICCFAQIVCKIFLELISFLFFQLKLELFCQYQDFFAVFSFRSVFLLIVPIQSVIYLFCLLSSMKIK